jgi:hypothetical protein
MNQTKAKRTKANDVTEFLATAYSIFNDFSAKMERLTQNAIEISRQFEHGLITPLHRKLIKTAFKHLKHELEALEDPIGFWIDRSSAVLEEGRITQLQREELRLRLTEFENKYHTAVAVFGELKYVEQIPL